MVKHTQTHTGILFIHEKGILPFVTTLMDTEDIMLREISQTEQDRYCILCICGI